MAMEEAFYFDEVIGSAKSYHRPSCHIVDRIRDRNRKLLRSWQEAVELGLEPCPHCRPPFIEREQAHTQSEVRIAPPISPPAVVLTPTDLGDYRRKLLRLLDSLEKKLGASSSGDGVARRIRQLEERSAIPRHIAQMMRTISETRNEAEYNPDAVITDNVSAAIIGSWSAIEEWSKN